MTPGRIAALIRRLLRRRPPATAREPETAVRERREKAVLRRPEKRNVA